MHSVDSDVASIVLRIAYGYTISKDDPLVVKCRQITAEFMQMASPKFLVNKFPARACNFPFLIYYDNPNL